MSSSVWPDHLLTLEEWERLPEDTTRHYELVEGVLQVSPRPLSKHQRAMVRLCAQVEPQLPSGWGWTADSEVVVDPDPPVTIRAPDVLIVPQSAIDDDRPRFAAADVLLAVEIVSPGSRRVDRIMKFAEYAEAGIEHYWIVDLVAPVDLAAYRLVDGAYRQIVAGSGIVELDAPFPLHIDLPALVAPHG